MYPSIEFLFFMFKRRDRATIIADILKSVTITARGRRKTNIMQSANLSSDQLNKYLDLLLRNGYVILDDGNMYKATHKGLRVLQNLEAEYLRLKSKF